MNEPTTSHVHGIPIPFAASVSFSDQNRRCGGGRGGGEGGANEHADIIHVHVAKSAVSRIISIANMRIGSTNLILDTSSSIPKVSRCTNYLLCICPSIGQRSDGR